MPNLMVNRYRPLFIPAALVPTKVAKAREAAKKAGDDNAAAIRDLEVARRHLASLEREVVADIAAWPFERKNEEAARRAYAVNLAEAKANETPVAVRAADRELKAAEAAFYADPKSLDMAVKAYTEARAELVEAAARKAAAEQALTEANRFWQAVAHAQNPDTYPMSQGQSPFENQRVMQGHLDQIPAVPFFSFQGGWQAERDTARVIVGG